MVRKRGHVAPNSDSDSEGSSPTPRKPSRKKPSLDAAETSRKNDPPAELDNTTTDATSEPPQMEGMETEEAQTSNLRPTREQDDGDGENDANIQPLRSLEELLDVDIPPLPVHTMRTDGTGRRLIISKIVNENFKSYKGRHVIGPFHTNFTSIVGPNGSGKSNVIDSILFVFGFKASKMRFKKMAEVIHSGEPRPRSCTVEIHFEEIIDKPDGGFERCPGTELEVRRTASMDNSSSYYLNGRKTNYKQVATVLKGRGIDLDHNRFLILQGEVEQIAQMQPKAVKEGDTDGMLEYLEDIIGSSRLKAPLEQLNTNMEELSEQRSAKLNKLKQAEKEKSELEGPRNEAIAFLKDENKLARKNHRLAQIHLLECKNHVEQAKKAHDEAKVEYHEKSAKIQEMKTEIEERKKKSKTAKKKVEEAQQGFNSAREKFAKLDAVNMKLNEEGKSARKKLESLRKDIGKLEKQVEETEARPERLEKETEKLRHILAECKTKQVTYAAEHEEAMAKVPAATQKAEGKKNEFQQELIAMQAKVGEAKNQMNMAQGALDLRLQEYEKEKSRLTEMQRKLEDTTANVEKAQKTLEEADSLLPKEQRSLQMATEMVRALEEREGNLRIQVEEKKAKVQEVKGQMKESKSTNATLNALMAEKRGGRITGIYGRLGDLGRIDKEFDVAVSTACAPLDHILVDTTETATKCLNFLKATQGGRGNFLALDVVTRKQKEFMSKPFRGPEGVSRLFDLIAAEDDKFLPAFYFGLRDTLVVENIDEATRIGLGGPKRFRVVTLDGKLIETSGTMTGGGGRPQSGRMGASTKNTSRLSLSNEEMESMQRKIHELTKDLEAARKEKYDTATSIEKLDKTVRDLTATKKTAEMELKGFQRQNKTYEAGLAPLRQKVEAKKPSEEELQSLRDRLDEAKSQYEGYSNEEKKVQDEVDKLNEEISRITEGIAGNVGERLRKVTEDIENHEKTIVKNQTTIKNTGRQVDKLKDKLKSCEQEMTEAEETIKTTKEKAEDLVSEGTKLANDAKNFEEELKKATEETDALKEEVKAIEKEEQALGVEFIKLKSELDKASETLKKFEQKKLGQEHKLESLKLHDMEKYVGKPKPKPQAEPDRSRVLADEEPGTSAEPMEEEHGDEEEEERMERMEDDEEDEWSIEFRVYTVEELEQMSAHDINFEIASLNEALSKRKPNISVIAEYRKKEARYDSCMEEHQKVCRLRDRVKDKYEQLRKQRYKEFQTGFNVISLKLKEMYQMITLGGDAELEFVDTLDPFADGISFTVRPPKKSWKQISNLSGGERTLSSLALVFALHHYKPTPLYVMDEIDAALDFKNVSIIAHYIKDRTKNAQFIIISLRNNMFELADRLVGIYKTYNSTKHVVVNPGVLALQPSSDSKAVQENQSQRVPVH